jgi:hypothetical protein
MSDKVPDVPETIWKYTDLHGVVKESWVMPVHGTYLNIAEYTIRDNNSLIKCNNELSKLVEELEGEIEKAKREADAIKKTLALADKVGK